MQRAANPWDRFYRYQAAPWRGEHAVADLLPHLEGRVLELGCGNGKMLRPLLRAGVDAVGLDISWNVLHSVQAPALVLGDAAALPFADGAFGAVLDIHCTGHLMAAGRQRAAREVHRVLRPGGVLVTERLAPDDLRTMTGGWTAEPGTRVVEDGRTTHFSDADALAAEFRQAGLVEASRSQVKRAISHRGTPVVRSSVRLLFTRP